jgi:hypothetical protein
MAHTNTSGLGMSRRTAHLRPQTLVLDAVFFAWLGYVVVTGNVLPSAIVSLFHHDQPAAAGEPAMLPVEAPILDTMVRPEASLFDQNRR